MSEKKQEKKLTKGQRIFVWIFAFIVLLFALSGWKNSTSTSTYVSEKTQKMRTVIENRIAIASENFKNEQPEFISMECANDCKEVDVNINYSEEPYIEWIKDTVDFIARGQAVNLSNELQDAGLSSQSRVYIYVWGKKIYRCTWYEWKIRACSDYR